MTWRSGIFLLLAVVVKTFAATAATIPRAEALERPTPGRIDGLIRAAQREGWAQQTAPLFAAAEQAYRADRLAAAEAWLDLYRWATLWGVQDAVYVQQWAAALDAARLRHPAFPATMPVRKLPMGDLLLPELQRWLLNNETFSTEFFSLTTPVDYLPAVFRILNEIHFDNPARFKTYDSLALAVALVYDVPPPPAWPHNQVSGEILPRRFPGAREAFAWWAREDEAGRTFQSLSQLGAEELKFVVDSAAPLSELEWSQQAMDLPLASLGDAYSKVRYDLERVQRDELDWSGGSYTLAAILSTGGICVDQAYFAAHVGKARGVPTLLFRGFGVSSRHAWFGFLDGNQEWQLDVGRWAEQRFVTGYVIDPQTWRVASDHELRFLAARFLRQPAYLQSRIHASFGANFLMRGNEVAGGAAALRAVKLEPRNFPAWETIIAAEQKLGFAAERREATFREASAALQEFPDLEAAYSARLSESLRARGKKGEAEAEEKRMAEKHRDDRGDIALLRARIALVEGFDRDPLPKQINAFNALVAAQPKDTALLFFNQIVLVFVEHLIRVDQRDEAAKAVEYARRTLQVDASTLLARDFDRLASLIKAAP